jgi:hypothetical protein
MSEQTLWQAIKDGWRAGSPDQSPHPVDTLRASGRVVYGPTTRGTSVEADLQELQAIYRGVDVLTYEAIRSPFQDYEVRSLKLDGRNGWARTRFEVINCRARRGCGH